jgi:SAM-dependent methyltransferase
MIDGPSRRADLLPEVALRRYETLKRDDPVVSITALTLGDRALEWLAAVAPFFDPETAAALPPLPPETLRRVVSDYQAPMFLWTGVVDAEMFLSAAARHGRGGDAARPRVLVDFGGGCGRVSRHLVHARNTRVVLTDANKEHVRWCAENLKSATCLVNSPRPPLPAAIERFDAMLALSVFTHLSSDAFDAWLDEIGRVARKSEGGGLLVSTTHGPSALRRIASNDTLRHYFRMTEAEATKALDETERGGFVYRRYDADQLSAANAGDDYGSTFVSKDEMRRRAARAGFEVLEHVDAGMRGWQDLVVLRPSS